MSVKLGSPDLFAKVKRLLLDAGFDERGLAEIPGPDEPRGLLATLYLQARAVEKQAIQNLLGAGGFDSLWQLGLLAADPEDDRFCLPTVILYPLHGLHIVSDFPGKDEEDEFVFPAISVQTHEYLSIIPATPCENLLEVGTGSGAAALLAASHAQNVVAADVSRRCLLFAEFNRRLNGIENVRTAESDVYEGLGEETFDRIVAHPPYVPWTGRQEIYRHGGPTGEAVLFRLISGLPERLRAGGRLYASTMGADTADAPFERRLRDMLGQAGNEFDILVAEREFMKPSELAIRWSEEEKFGFEQAWKLNEAFLEHRIKRFVRCSLVIARREGSRPEPLTLRRPAGSLTGAAELDAALDAVAAPPATWEARLETRPRLSPQVRLETVSTPAEGKWNARSRILESQFPFVFRSDCPEWAAELLPCLQGGHTLRDAIEGLDVDEEELEVFLGCLFDAGVLNVSE